MNQTERSQEFKYSSMGAGFVLASMLFCVGLLLFVQPWRTVGDKEVTVVEADSSVVPDEEQREGIDDQTSAKVYGATSSDEPAVDPHLDPRWIRFRRQWVASHEIRCQWKGCKDVGPGLNLHHCWPEKYVGKAGHPELGYTEENGQAFLLVCRKHHELCHNIGYGGSWGIFDKDAVEDATAGKWNSRGKSKWEFKSEAEAVAWVKQQIDHNTPKPGEKLKENPKTNPK